MESFSLPIPSGGRAFLFSCLSRSFHWLANLVLTDTGHVQTKKPREYRQRFQSINSVVTRWVFQIALIVAIDPIECIQAGSDKSCLLSCRMKPFHYSGGRRQECATYHICPWPWDCLAKVFLVGPAPLVGSRPRSSIMHWQQHRDKF